jgi:hypothetical protein
MADKTKKIIEIEVDAKTGKVTVLAEKIEDVGKKTKETKNQANELGGALDKATGGAISKFKGLASTIGGVTKSFGSLKGAIIATGLGALLLVITSIAAAFNSSEEGQNKYAKIMGIIGVVTGNLVDLLADLGEKLISAFENPQESLESFGKLIQENLVNRFNGLLELLPQLGNAINLLFEGKFSEAGKVAVNAVAKVSLGVENITDKIEGAIDATKRFIDEQLEEGATAAKVADMRAKADKIERKLIVERSIAESKIAQLRLKSRQEDEFGAEERMAALIEAQKLEDELLDKETQYLELRKNAQILENTFSRTNKENLTKEAQAIAAVNNQVAARANTARQLQRELNAIAGQIEMEEKSRQAAKIKAAQEIRDIMAQFDAEDAAAEKERIKQKEIDDKAAADRAIALAQRESAAKQQIQTSLFAGARLLAERFGKQSEKQAKQAFQIQKALGIAETLFNTGKAVTAALTAGGNPIKLATGLQFLEAAAVASIGAIQVATIAGTQFSASGGNSSGGGMPSISAPTATAQAPQFNTVGTSGFNQLSDSIAVQNQRPVQAYVVANDVSSAQSLDRNRVRQASFP